MCTMAAAEKAANAIGGRTARACDNCIRRRARWYCAADDAFLCQGCDSSVHSANQLSRRHNRVRLEAASSKGSSNLAYSKFADNTVPAWHHGFTRKARTPRNKKLELKLPAVDLVPEISDEFDQAMDEKEIEEHFFYFRVPEFDPFSADEVEAAGNDDGEFILAVGDDACDVDINELFLPTELDLAEFAADVDIMLGNNGVEEVEDGEAVTVKSEVELEEQRTEEAGGDCGRMEKKDIMEEEKKKKKMLSLNYEDVMKAWSCQVSPWTTGVRHGLFAGDTWPHYMGTDLHESSSGAALRVIRSQSADPSGRKERVSRYREKRRTRMFSKKIRYQVRKLNAEKRPRMKGRFVKRTSSSFLPHAN